MSMQASAAAAAAIAAGRWFGLVGASDERTSVGSIPIPKGLSFHSLGYFYEVHELISQKKSRFTVPKFEELT